jgi:hypothetical protein
MREFTGFHRLAKVSVIDVGARVVHSRPSINTRGFWKANQSQLSFVLCSLSISLSLCTVLYFTELLSIHGDPVTHYTTLVSVYLFHREFTNLRVIWDEFSFYFKRTISAGTASKSRFFTAWFNPQRGQIQGRILIWIWFEIQLQIHTFSYLSPVFGTSIRFRDVWRSGKTSPSIQKQYVKRQKKTST